MSIEANRFQRVGARSNAHAGSEQAVQAYFADTGLKLTRDFAVPIGYAKKKSHRFDLGSEAPPVLVECKSCTWTAGGNTPSAKLRSFNEAVLHFAVSPTQYRKILMLLKDIRGSEVLAAITFARRATWSLTTLKSGKWMSRQRRRSACSSRSQSLSREDRAFASFGPSRDPSPSLTRTLRVGAPPSGNRKPCGRSPPGDRLDH